MAADNSGGQDASSQVLLEVRAVSKGFPGVQALTEVTCTVAQGEVHALVGQNGAGKSTLVKCITGVYRPDAGEILFDGQAIRTFSPPAASALGIEVVHQRTTLLPWLSVAENIHLGRMPTRFGVIDRRRANQRTRELLARFELDVDPDTPVGLLSVSERQELAIARAVFRDARLLVLDEPTAALDAEQSQHLFSLVENLTSQGVSVVYVSHYLEEIFALADRITVLRDGRLVKTERTAETNEKELVRLMVGHDLAVGADVDQAPPAEVTSALALKFEQVTTDVLQGVSLSIGIGEVVGITGVIGAGGHEIADVLFGLIRPRGGTIQVAGDGYEPRGPREALDHDLCLVPEDPVGKGLVAEMTVASNISLVGLKSFSHLGVLSLRREREVARRYVKELGITTWSVDTPVRNLSGGNQQKVLLARALASGARILILEEPTQGVDINAKSEIHKIIRKLVADGRAAVVISTDVQDLLQFVDRVIALRRGRVAGDVRAQDTSFAEIVELTVGSATEERAA